MTVIAVVAKGIPKLVSCCAAIVCSSIGLTWLLIGLLKLVKLDEDRRMRHERDLQRQRRNAKLREIGIEVDE